MMATMVALARLGLLLAVVSLGMWTSSADSPMMECSPGCDPNWEFCDWTSDECVACNDCEPLGCNDIECTECGTVGGGHCAPDHWCDEGLNPPECIPIPIG